MSSSSIHGVGRSLLSLVPWFVWCLERQRMMQLVLLGSKNRRTVNFEFVKKRKTGHNIGRHEHDTLIDVV